MTLSEYINRSRSNDDLRRGRYLPDGKLNIAGRWNSPGPGKYLLPSTIGFVKHDFTLNKAPAHVIGNRWPDLTKESQSPGPIYSPQSNVTHLGKKQASSAYITSRPREYGLWIGPGPGRYSPEKARQERGPAYTIGQKHKHLEKPDHNVGPNQYSMKNTIASENYVSHIKTAPRVTMGARTKFMSTTYGMGESADQMYYPKIDFIKSDAPKWTIAGKNYMPSMDSRIPGPKYYPPLSHLKSSPQVSMGIRHSEFCSTGLPAHYSNENDF